MAKKDILALPKTEAEKKVYKRVFRRWAISNSLSVLWIFALIIVNAWVAFSTRSAMPNFYYVRFKTLGETLIGANGWIPSTSSGGGFFWTTIACYVFILFLISIIIYIVRLALITKAKPIFLCLPQIFFSIFFVILFFGAFRSTDQTLNEYTNLERHALFYPYFYNTVNPVIKTKTSIFMVMSVAFTFIGLVFNMGSAINVFTTLKKSVIESQGAKTVVYVGINKNDLIVSFNKEKGPYLTIFKEMICALPITIYCAVRKIVFLIMKKECGFFEKYQPDETE